MLLLFLKHVQESKLKRVSDTTCEALMQSEPNGLENTTVTVRTWNLIQTTGQQTIKTKRMVQEPGNKLMTPEWSSDDKRSDEKC